MPDSMIAAYVTELGPVENIQVGPLPVPPLGQSEVLVAVQASAVNPVDTFVRAWETSGHHDLALAASAIGPAGRILLTAADTTQVSLPVPPLYTRDVDLLGFVISRARVTDLAAAAALINDLLVVGALDVRALQILPLTEAGSAHRLVEQGETRGRLVLTVSDSQRG